MMEGSASFGGGGFFITANSGAFLAGMVSLCSAWGYCGGKNGCLGLRTYRDVEFGRLRSSGGADAKAVRW